MHLISSSKNAVPILPPKRKAPVSDEICREAKITSHANSCFDGVISNDANHNQRLVTADSKPLLKVGANKSVIHAFRNNRLSVYRGYLRLEIIPRLSRPIVRFGVR